MSSSVTPAKKVSGRPRSSDSSVSTGCNRGAPEKYPRRGGKSVFSHRLKLFDICHQLSDIAANRVVVWSCRPHHRGYKHLAVAQFPMGRQLHLFGGNTGTISIWNRERTSGTRRAITFRVPLITQLGASGTIQPVCGHRTSRNIEMPSRGFRLQSCSIPSSADLPIHFCRTAD